MGSLISLGIGRLEVDWGKNSFFRNHSALFLPEDVKPAPYFYADDVVEQKPAYARSLRSVVRRLELLGYTLPRCQDEYEHLKADWPHCLDPVGITFDQFASVLRAVDVLAVNPSEDGDYDLGEYVSKAVMSDPQFAEID